MNFSNTDHRFVVIAIEGKFDIWAIKHVFEYWYNTVSKPETYRRGTPPFPNWESVRSVIIQTDDMFHYSPDPRSFKRQLTEAINVTVWCELSAHRMTILLAPVIYPEEWGLEIHYSFWNHMHERKLEQENMRYVVFNDSFIG